MLALLAPGEISDPDIDNIVGFQGALFDNTAQQYDMRHRVYDAGLGRFLQRDPAGYVDGMSLYEFAMSRPGRAA